MFNVNLLSRNELERININGKRHYISPEGEVYPSVTTLMGAYFDKSFLDKWKNKVGQKEAEAIKNRSAHRGTRLHKICEKYMLNESDYLKGQMPSAIDDFKRVQPILDNNVREVYGIEFPVFSKKLKVAGTADLICNWNGLSTVVDYKTSRKNKKEEWIQNYFCQTTAYAIALNENYAIDIRHVVIILLIEHEQPAIFLRKIENYENLVYDICIQNRPMV